MPSCCYGDEYESVFTPKEAARTVNRFRRKGLGRPGRELVSALVSTGLSEATILDVGGGVGEIGVALLESGAASRIVNLELSPSWEEAAQRLLRERGLEDRVQREVGDFVDSSLDLPQADLVLLHRVVCCYPDWRAMLDAAVARSERLIAITVPVDRWWTRTAVWLGNAVMRGRGLTFRAYVHPPQAMVEKLRSNGFSVVHDWSRRAWRTLILAGSA